MSKLITSLFFIIAAILLTNVAAVEYDYCCDSMAAIPDSRAYGEGIVSVTQPGADNCQDENPTMDINLDLDANMDTDSVYLCIDNATYTCAPDTWEGFMEVDCDSKANKCAMNITNTERVSTTDVVVRFENCAGYSDKPLTLEADFTTAPEITVEYNTEESQGRCSDATMVFDITVPEATDTMNVELNETSGNDNGNGKYTFPSLDVDAPYYLHVFASNCAGNATFSEKYTSPDTPSVTVAASDSGYDRGCDDYDATLSISADFNNGATASEDDFDASYVCYDNMCEQFTGTGLLTPTISNLYYNTTYTPKVTLEYCGSNLTADSFTLDPSYQPTITDVVRSEVPNGVCMYDEVDFIFTVTLSEYQQALSDVSACIGGECKDLSQDGTEKQFQNTFTLNVTDEEYTFEVNVTNCIGDSAVDSRSYTISPTEYSATDLIVTYNACPTSPQNISVSFKQPAWTGAASSDTYQINVTSNTGEQWSLEQDATVEDSIEVPRDAFPLTTKVVDLDICSMADIGAAEMTVDLDPVPELTIENVTTSQTTSETNECENMVRELQVEFPETNEEMANYSYCIRVEDDTGCTSEGSFEFESTSQMNRINEGSLPLVDIDKNYNVTITAEFKSIDCPQDSVQYSMVVPIMLPDITTVPTITESTKCLSSNGTCVPEYTFQVTHISSIDLVAGIVQDRYCMSEGCGYGDMMDVDASTIVDTMDFAPNFSEETYYLRATSLYCGKNDTNPGIEQETKTSPSYSHTNGQGFAVSLSIDSETCLLTPSFTNPDGYYAGLDQTYYCFESGDTNEYCMSDDEWFRSNSEDDPALPNALNMTEAMRVRAYPARCSGWLAMPTASNQVAPPASPSFSGETFTVDDVSGNCDSWSVDFSWSSAQNTDQYGICASLNTPITACPDPLRTASSPSLTLSSSDIGNPPSNTTIYIAVQASSDVACSGTDSISGSIDIPALECPSSSSSGSQSSSSGNSGSGSDSGSQSDSGSASASASSGSNASGSGSGSGSGNNGGDGNDSSDASSYAVSFTAVLVAACLLMNNML
eukprot:gb/GECH01011323.1/.p1 GENE.gb/GECH01011323.1/~~gb/GECH01011323.1/.p1  ORF type:complete len:1045 (+),score=182.71 gb/GECH01011323.1/:1-3135(+)